MAEIFKQRLNVYSKKHNIYGVVLDFGMVTKLYFSWKGKDVEIGIKVNPLRHESLEEKAIACMDTYIDDLSSPVEKSTMLHHWYLEQRDDKYGKYIVAWGIVTGHPQLPDSEKIHTSMIQNIRRDGDEIVLTTRHTEYHCPLAYCRFRKMEETPEILPDFDALRAEYEGKEDYPTIEPGNVLLVLADFDHYYYHSAYYVPAGDSEAEPARFSGSPHIGTYQDSYLVISEDNRIDLRYFPHFRNIEFYSEDTDGCPLWLQNIGRSVLYAATSAGAIKLNPGERKEVVEENAEDDAPVLPKGDLYPAGVEMSQEDMNNLLKF